MKTRIATTIATAALLALASCSTSDTEEPPEPSTETAEANQDDNVEDGGDPPETDTDTDTDTEADEASPDLPDHNTYLLDAMGYESWDDAGSDSWAWCVTDIESATTALVRVHTECTAAQLPDDLANAVWNFLAYSDEAEPVDWVEVMDASGTHYEQMHRNDNPLASN